jgi:hypothetical protein
MRPRGGPDPNYRLEAGKIIKTAKNLADDINLRLSESNLAGLAEELAAMATATEARGGRARRPFLTIRAFSAPAISWSSWGSGIPPGTSKRGGSSVRSPTSQSGSTQSSIS